MSKLIRSLLLDIPDKKPTIEFLISSEDEWLVNKIAWYENHNGYLVGELVRNKVRYVGFLHSLIMEEKLKQGFCVDHINRIKTDNRRENLRIVTVAENNRNTAHISTNKSGCRGVAWDPVNNRWRVQAEAYGKKYHLGRFDSKSEACKVYRAFKEVYHPEFTKTEDWLKHRCSE